MTEDLKELRLELKTLRKLRTARAIADKRVYLNQRPDPSLLSSQEMADALGISQVNFRNHARSIGARPRIGGHRGICAWWSPEDYAKTMKIAIAKERKS